ncbi:hypothetical protein BO71DRAFT_327315 [Aspergillus ellipticus CBS 707.79]|uniref:Actin binding protein n=1 Tax=Aspergillus ellipticus CBS 707.79 TaxID=1448320 RepID=A0A319DHL1_9EURO|nr:hypothetical protein BO71DRAFT_327315 [Aspergillus ellipticus CBS 707.79]
MAALNLSANGPSISKSYETVINATVPSSGAASPTYGQWAIFSVSTPLVNAFQRDSGNKESILKVQDTGAGELVDLIDEFSEGKIQFAYVKVTDPNSGLPKNVLIAWCGEGVPERTKGYFTSHLSAVSKFLHGYHVQITARAEGDLTAEGIIHKVGDASGAKYTPTTVQQRSLAAEPPVSMKPAFTPSRNASIGLDTTAAGPIRAQRANGDDDGWGPNAPPVTRTELEKVQSAYKPTKVNIQELKSDKEPATKTSVEHPPYSRDNVVKGGYQPVGKVDIAAIRRQAREAGSFGDDRPEPIKGAYEPIGKVDIAAIRSKAQDRSTHSLPNEDGHSASNQTQNPVEHTLSPGRSIITGDSERLTSLPKPKVSNKFGVTSSFRGTKPPLPSSPASKPNSATVQIGSASRTFADEGGKTPAQLWAERKARERGQDVPPSHSSNAEAIGQSQHSDAGEWKSSYSGKTWAPVQTTHTGKSVGSDVSQPHQAPGYLPTETSSTDIRASQQSVSSIRDQIARGSSMGPPLEQESTPDNGHNASLLHEVRAGPTDPETFHGPVTHQPFSAPSQQARSPSPQTPVRETSPIRVAAPVGKGAADAHDEQPLLPSPLPIGSPQEKVASDEDTREDKHDPRRVTSETTLANDVHGQGIEAVVQYDYEKAEDNEIELKEGEYVTDIEMVDKDWWLGSNSNGDRGLFPSNYVEVVAEGQNMLEESGVQENEPQTDPVAITPDVESPAPAPAEGHTATALYDYEAAEDNELSFPEGADIKSIEFPDDDWWFGEYLGRRGLFPANYVELGK